MGWSCLPRNDEGAESMNILSVTIGGVPVSTLVVGMIIVICVVWLWSRWDQRQAQKRRVKRAEYQASFQDQAGVRDREAENASVRTKPDENSRIDEFDCARAIEEAKRVLREIPLPAPSTNKRDA